MSRRTPKRVGITLGDCAGIGPEIVELALKSGRVPDSIKYVILGRQPNCKPGKPTKETASAAAAALEEAVTLARRSQLEAIVTGPVHKARMYEVGFRFPGQTEFFAERCGVKNFAMCLTGGKLTVALVTAHVPLCKVPRALKQSEIVRVGQLLAEFVRSRGKTTPRIAVTGLNPHAGESGKLGREEIEMHQILLTSFFVSYSSPPFECIAFWICIKLLFSLYSLLDFFERNLLFLDQSM